MTRRAIVDAAVTLFSESSFETTSMQTLVEAAGVTKGAFYHHFSSKEELLREIHNSFVDYELKLARSALDTVTDPDELFRVLLEDVLLNPAERFKREMGIFLRERHHLTGDLFREITTKREEFVDAIVEILERGVKLGAYRSLGDTRIIAFALIGMCAWTTNWLDPTRGVDEIHRMFFEFAYLGLKAGEHDRRDGVDSL